MRFDFLQKVLLNSYSFPTIRMDHLRHSLIFMTSWQLVCTFDQAINQCQYQNDSPDAKTTLNISLSHQSKHPSLDTIKFDSDVRYSAGTGRT